MDVDLISFAYAATIAAGGIIGYVKAGEFNVSFEVEWTSDFCNILFFNKMHPSGFLDFIVTLQISYSGCRLQRLFPDILILIPFLFSSWWCR